MSRAAEIKRLKANALKSGGYIASPCPECTWWRLDAGDRVLFERDYSKSIRCTCSKEE